jgi:hypothetical protein
MIVVAGGFVGAVFQEQGLQIGRIFIFSFVADKLLDRDGRDRGMDYARQVR